MTSILLQIKLRRLPILTEEEIDKFLDFCKSKDADDYTRWYSWTLREAHSAKEAIKFIGSPGSGEAEFTVVGPGKCLSVQAGGDYDWSSSYLYRVYRVNTNKWSILTGYVPG